MLAIAFAFLEASLCRGQLVVSLGGANAFGSGRAVAQPTAQPTAASASYFPALDAGSSTRIGSGQAGYKPASQWEQHRQHGEAEKEMEALKHADSALAYLEERAVKKLQADVDEVDSLIGRRHMLTDRAEENALDVQAIQVHAGVLEAAAADLRKRARWADAASAADDAAQLKAAAYTLKGGDDEVRQVSEEIEASTEDGRRMDRKVKLFAKQRASLRRQITVVTVESDHLQEQEETVQDLEAFEKAGYQGVTDDNDPYVQEAQNALEVVSGWDSNKLDEDAVKAREAMTRGLAANPGQAVEALKALGHHPLR